MARPEVFLKILDYSPLPTQMVEAIKQLINTPQPKSPEQQKIEALQVAGAVAKITKDQAQAELYQKQAASTEATSMYDLAMAQNLLLKHGGDMAAAFNEAKKAGFEAAKTAAETGHIAAKTDTERANAENVRADTVHKHAGALNAHVGTMIDALTPIHHSDPETGGPHEPAPQPAMA